MGHNDHCYYGPEKEKTVELCENCPQRGGCYFALSEEDNENTLESEEID
jgi:hypothetical protein